MNCPYCYQPAEHVSNAEVYGKPYGRSHMIWLCRPCDAYVGCVNNTRKPKGTMAKKSLRMMRVKAHNAFDPLWRDGPLTRSEAYDAISRDFGFEVHIGQSDEARCLEIIVWVNKYRERNLPRRRMELRKVRRG